MSASSVLRSACLRASNGRYLLRLSGVKSNCELCNSETVTRPISTLGQRCVFRCCRRYMSQVRVRLTSIRPVNMCHWIYVAYNVQFISV